MSWADTMAECHRMAETLGWEDIHARKKKDGVTKFDARVVVFGLQAANAWMEREIKRSHGRRKDRAREDVPA